jgi:DNA-binding CsgD family transcriptional regulator
MTLGIHELKAINRFNLRVLQHDGFRDLSAWTLDEMSTLLKADRGNFYLTDPGTHRLIWPSLVTKGISMEKHRQWEEHYYRWDPFIRQSVLRFYPEPVYAIDDLVRVDVWTKRSVYFNDFLKPQDIYSELVLSLKDKGQLIGYVALFRGRNDPCFSKKDKEIAASVFPYIVCALKKTLMSETLLGYEILTGRLGDQLPQVAVMVLDEGYRCLLANRAARSLVSAFSSEKQTSGNGVASPEDAIRHFCKEYVERLDHTEEGCETRFELVHPITKIRVQANISFFSVPGMRRLLVITMESEDPVIAVNEKLKALKLTAREAEVSSLVCLGFSNGIIAAKLFISEGTVENHLLSIYDKMGVNNRTSLVCRIHEISQKNPCI